MAFRKDFLWGAASASYQIEGAAFQDGKGENIWDKGVKIKDRIVHGENGNVACDHYHLFREDVKLMKEMGLKAYRFSVNWARVLPEGTGKVNSAGIRFYSDLVDELCWAGIEPLVSIFHWDYPEYLHQKGGWLNEESPEWFAYYTKVLVDALSDRVTYWLTINEPQIFVDLGYRQGIFAPFEKHTRKELATISHHVLLAHGKAVSVIRKYAKKKPLIGLAPTGPTVIPEKETEQEIEKARKTSFSISCFGESEFLFSNSWWLDPVFLGKYPEDANALLGDDMPEVKEGDMKIISEPLDFIGANIYQSLVPGVGAEAYAQNCYQGCPRTMTDWAITPEVLYWSARFMTERYKLPFLITENGMAGMDFVHLDGKVHDSQRIDYMHRYLKALKRAADENIDIMGYMAWSVMDNFEWASGYDKRFGLVYVDYQTQERILKDSAYWYREVIGSNGENL
ncbi:MAG: GH1 family beta-glucosidase [Lachnospiraceae bacterium]|nr:GH1 family beta-glucosidase [Lachnospiraceae bacterium]